MKKIAAESLVERLVDWEWTRSSGCPETLPTQGSADPALTIMALAARVADQLVAGQRRGLR